MWSFFKKKKPVPAYTDFSFLGCDMHSHLIPGIDDGARTEADSLELIGALRERGFRKIITTPHVYGDFYDNSGHSITEHFQRLSRTVQEQQPGLQMGVAAEYFMDAHFLSEVLPSGLLTFGDQYVLVEVSIAGWPRNLHEIIFAIQSKGYKPVLAHPERYNYEQHTDVLEGLKEKGVLMQLNLLAMLGYYGASVKALANQLLDRGMYEFCGTDTHHIRHVKMLDRLLQEQPEAMHKLIEYKFFRNISLLEQGDT